MTTLEGIINKNEERETTEFFQLLVTKFKDFESFLRQTYKNEEILHNKSLNSV